MPAPRPPSDPISMKTIGFMGESLTAFVLENEFGTKGLKVASLGDQNFPWDLFIFEPAEGTPFTGPTAIQVKATSMDNSRTEPTPEGLHFLQGICGKLGYDLWLSFVHYGYKKGHMQFGVYLVRGGDIHDEDFAGVRRYGKNVPLLKVIDMRERASLRYRSMELKIEEREDGNGDVEGGPMEEDFVATVSKEVSGVWGEDMATFLLRGEFRQMGLRVANVGRGYEPYDLFVDGKVANTPFDRQAAISVKANSFKSDLTKPSFGEMDRLRTEMDQKGVGLWFALMQYNYSDSHLGFGMYLVDARTLVKEDFVTAGGWEMKKDLLSISKAKGKAVSRLWTKRMDERKGRG